LEEKIRPQPRLLDQLVLDELPRPIIGNGEEGADEVAVVGEDLDVKIKDTHVPPSEGSYENHFLLCKRRKSRFFLLTGRRKPLVPGRPADVSQGFPQISSELQPSSDQPGSST